MVSRYYFTHDVEVVDINVGDNTCPQIMPDESGLGAHISYNDSATQGWPIDGSVGMYRNLSFVALKNKVDGSYRYYSTHAFLSLDQPRPKSDPLLRTINSTQAVRAVLQSAVLYPTAGNGPWLENNSVYPVDIHHVDY